MGPEWELLTAAAAAQAKEEAHQKKQRMKQIKNKKLEDKSKIQKVLLEDDEGPIFDSSCNHQYPKAPHEAQW